MKLPQILQLKYKPDREFLKFTTTQKSVKRYFFFFSFLFFYFKIFLFNFNLILIKFNLI